MPSRAITLVAFSLLTATAACSPSGDAEAPSATPSAPVAEVDYTPDPQADAQLVRDFGCTGCADEVQVVPGLVHEGEPVRLIVTEAELEMSEFGQSRKAAVFMVRNSDDELLATNTNSAPTDFVPLPNGDFDTTWNLDSNGNFVLLTQSPDLPEQQLVAWLDQSDLETVERFTHQGMATSGQTAVETVDMDEDGSVEVVGYLGDETPQWAERDVKFFYKFHAASASYLPWRCSESTDGGTSYPEPATMYEAPCYEFGSGPLPWSEGE